MTDGMATASEALDEDGNTNDSALAVTSLLVNTLKSLSKWQACNDTSIVSRVTLT